MHIFYAPGIDGGSYVLDEDESKHCIRVLRMQKGTSVRLIDGRGSLYEGTISQPDPRRCIIEINSVQSDFEKRSYKLHLAVSPLKNQDRFEWFIEKSVEIGVDQITPLICRNTEKPGIKPERLKNLIISAMKQSVKTTATILNEPCTFNDFIGMDTDGIRMIAHCNRSLPRRPVSEVYSSNNDAVILIGPEGDFSEQEINAATSVNFAPVHLGTSRLRTETAGIAACYSVYFMNQ